MINDLISVANKLDEIGLKKEADTLDQIIKKIANHTTDGLSGSREKEIRSIEKSIKNLISSNDPLISWFGGACYYSMLLALSKIHGSKESQHGDSNIYKQRIDESIRMIEKQKMNNQA